MVWGDNNVVRRDYAVRRYANNKRKQSLVAEFFPDVNQITSLAHTHRPLPFSNPLERFWYSQMGEGQRVCARADATVYTTRIEINSPPRFRRNVDSWTRTHLRSRSVRRIMCTHTLRAHARFPGQDVFGVGVDRRSIRSHAFGRCRDASWHVAREEREKVGGERLCTAYSGVSATLGMKRRAHIGKGAIVARRLRIRGGSWWRRWK